MKVRLPEQEEQVEISGTKTRCNVHTKFFQDIGLVWSVNQRRRVSQCTNILYKSEEEEYEEEDEDAPALLELGLPISFGTAQIDHEASRTHRHRLYESDIDIYEIPNIGHPRAPPGHPSTSPSPSVTAQQWQQAYDHSMGHFYYYCKETQQTQWEPPSCGFLPVPMEWLLPAEGATIALSESPSACHEAQEDIEISGNLHHEPPHPRMQSTGMMPRLLTPQGRHILFSDMDDGAEGGKDEEGPVLFLPPEHSARGAEGCPEELLELGQMDMGQIDVDMDLAGEDTIPCEQRGDDDLGGDSKEKRGVRRSKRRGRRSKSGKGSSTTSFMRTRRPAHIPLRLHKYWLQRYSLFSRYDEGIAIDDEGWFSATPEVIAWHHAKRVASAVGPGCIAVDAFAGVGGNAIQLALAGCQVIAIEIDPTRAALVRHNASVYGVAHMVDVVCADFLDVARRLRADAVLLSPPWGGPEYSKQDEFDVEYMGGHEELGLSPLLRLAFNTMGCRTVVAWVPRNSSLHQIESAAVNVILPTDDRTLGLCEVEKAVLNGVQKAVTLYYGAAAKD